MTDANIAAQALSDLLSETIAKKNAEAGIVESYTPSEVVNEGTKIILPENMTIPQAIRDLNARHLHLQQMTRIDETVDCFPLDGAYALELAIREQFGWSEGQTVWGMFGPEYPARIAVEVDYGKTEYVNWGAFTIPGIDGELHTSATRPTATEPSKFRVIFEGRRLYEPVIRKLIEATRQRIRSGGSIYQGKAIRLHFDVNESFFGAQCIASIKFMDLSDADPSKLIFAEQVENEIWDSIYTPITQFDRLAEIGEKFRRGVLLAGKYGTGKTETAKAAGKLATEKGLTFVYCDDGDQLATTFLFVQPYANPGAVVFFEDVDRFVTGERTEDMDRILNTLDGVDTKGANIMTVMTTNHVEDINPAMLRPGRMDAVINVSAPDAPAIEKLVRLYGGAAIAPDEDILWVCQKLAEVETLPAVVREVIKRAKLGALRHTPAGQAVTISAQDLNTAATSMAEQLRLLNRVTPAELSPEEKAALITVNGWKDMVNLPLTLDYPALTNGHTHRSNPSANS